MPQAFLLFLCNINIVFFMVCRDAAGTSILCSQLARIAVSVSWLLSYPSGSSRIACTMAHFPRWIESFNVDSPAMLVAFESYCRSQEDLETVAFEDHLLQVLHSPEEWTKHCNRCSQNGCQRCVTQRGGYTFRWCSLLWEEEYMKGRRKGSWFRGICEQKDKRDRSWNVYQAETWFRDSISWGFRMDCYGKHIQGTTLSFGSEESDDEHTEPPANA